VSRSNVPFIEKFELAHLFIRLFKISNEKYDLNRAWEIYEDYPFSPSLGRIADLVNYTKMTNDFRGIEIARKEAEVLNKSCERLKAFSMIAEVTNDERDIKRVKEEMEICGEDVMTPLKFREAIKQLCQEKKFKQVLELVKHYNYISLAEIDWVRHEIVRAMCQEKKYKEAINLIRKSKYLEDLYLTVINTACDLNDWGSAYKIAQGIWPNPFYKAKCLIEIAKNIARKFF
jgi:hypothetical protein